MRIALNLQGKTVPACNHCKSKFGNLRVTYVLKTQMPSLNLMTDHSTQMFGSVKSNSKIHRFFSQKSWQQYLIATIQQRVTCNFSACAQSYMCVNICDPEAWGLKFTLTIDPSVTEHTEFKTSFSLGKSLLLYFNCLLTKCCVPLHPSTSRFLLSPNDLSIFHWWLQSLWLCQEHVLWWGTLARLCFAKKFISSFYSLIHHSSFYKPGGDPHEDEMGISGGSPNERCLQVNKSPWSSEFCFTDTRAHTHMLTVPPSI